MQAMTRQPSTADVALAVDVGGTKIRAALVDRAGQIAGVVTAPTEAARGGAHVVETMRTLARAICDREIAGVGISAAGVIDPASGIVVDATEAIPGWRGTALTDVFKNAFAVQAFADNDVKCALRGEAWCGAAKPYTSGTVVMLTLGTGLGGALMHNGVMLTGQHHLAGHIGRMRMWDTPSPNTVSVESRVSGTGLVNIFRRLVSTQDGDFSGEEVMRAAAAGDKKSRQALELWLDQLAVQLTNLYWLLDPAVIVIGGGVIDSRETWWPLLQERLRAGLTRLCVLPAALGNDAGVVGAAALVWQHQQVQGAPHA
jgi:glucokinase